MLQRGLRNRHRNGLFSWGRVLVGLVIGLFILIVLAAGAAAAGGYAAWGYFSEDLPSVDHVETLQFQTTKIYDRNWKLLREVADPQTGWRTNVAYGEIMDHIRQQQDDPNAPHRAWIVEASVAAEDATFWSNPGVDPLAIGRGVMIMVSGAGSSGASTITQQLVRTIYPETIGNERSLTRKIREAITAYRFSKHYSKEQIMEMFLNNTYYGNRSYGIDAAAQSYFNKHAWDLTLGEASMLAGLPQAPSLYDPTQNYELAKARQRYVLDQMVKQGMITAEESDNAYAEPLDPQSRDGRYNLAPHFVNYVIYYLEQKYGAGTVYRGGLTVHTTLDYDLQETAQKIVADHVDSLAPWDVNNGALVAMLPWSGEVVAMVGSADYYNEAIDGQVNVATAQRQPGSSIKPITYLTAFEKGWYPGTVIFDYPKRWPTPGAPEPFYEPKNYTFQNYGAVTVRQALANSLNIPAVQALDYVGVPNMVDLAHKMGIRTGLWRGPSFYGLSITLGGGEVTLLEHTNAFATLANNGRYVPYTPLLDVTDGTGKTLFKLDPTTTYDQGEQVVKPEHAYQITSILTDNQARSMVFGTDTPLTLPELDNRPVAAKTGTTNDWKDGWTMGYTTDLTVGVWTGNTDSHPTRNLDGVQGAGPLWHDFMVAAHDPRFAKTLMGPDGQPIQTAFFKPPNVYEGQVCAATGHAPIRGARTMTEVLVKGEEPTLPCNKMNEYETEDLRAAMQSVARSRSFTSRGVQSLYEYAAMVGVAIPRPTPTPTPTEEPRRAPTEQPDSEPSPTETNGQQRQPTPTSEP